MPLLLAVGLVLASGLAAGAPATVAAAGDTSEPVAVYADNDKTVTVLYGNGTTDGQGVTADVVGPMANLDDDQYLEVPFVNGSSGIYIVDRTGETQTLVTDDAKNSKTYLPSGDWDGDGQAAVFYENTLNGKLYRVELGSSPQPILGPDGNKIATNSPIGLANFTDDGVTDLVFLGSSSTVKYYNGSAIGSTGNSNFGSNNGIGAPADFDGDGTARVPHLTSYHP